MSDDAIHDILEQTESDPAFQALFDLFDYSNYYLIVLSAVQSTFNLSHFFSVYRVWRHNWIVFLMCFSR